MKHLDNIKTEKIQSSEDEFLNQFPREIELAICPFCHSTIRIVQIIDKNYFNAYSWQCDCNQDDLKLLYENYHKMHGNKMTRRK